MDRLPNFAALAFYRLFTTGLLRIKAALIDKNTNGLFLINLLMLLIVLQYIQHGLASP